MGGIQWESAVSECGPNPPCSKLSTRSRAENLLENITWTVFGVDPICGRLFAASPHTLQVFRLAAVAPSIATISIHQAQASTGNKSSY
mmetsp:Transcript_15204/g.22304  ORF Transcript_15204/g.22304 Transcript_15204/m.22304 type:complete len:88 (-) Transcript_15204:162-425(-)